MKPQPVAQGFHPGGLKTPKIAESSSEMQGLCPEGPPHGFNPEAVLFSENLCMLSFPYKYVFYNAYISPGGSYGKESACSAEDLGSIPGSGRSPGGGHGNPLQYSGLENSMDRGAWRAIVHGAAKSWT